MAKTDKPKSRSRAPKVELTLMGDAAQGGRVTTLLDKRLQITTPRGVNPVESALIESAADIPAQHVWTLMMPTAITPMTLQQLRPETSAHYWHFDAFFTERARRQAGYNNVDLDLKCSPDLPLEEPTPDQIIWFARRDSEAGLTCELLTQAYHRLARGGKLIVAINNPNDNWLGRQIERTFPGVTRLRKDKKSIVYLAKKHETTPPLAEPDRFIKEIQVDFGLGQYLLDFETCYGTFSSDDLDDGSRALLEKMEPPDPCRSILDLGCGWGAMAVLAAKMTGATDLTLVDSNSRAIDMARRNLKRHGLDNANIILTSEALIRAREENWGPFDLVVTNPPYSTEFRVTEMFLETAFHVLRPGGKVWLVGKNNNKLISRTGEIFENVIPLRRRGFDVVGAEKY